MTSSTAPKPWERREGETMKSYRGFVAYLEMGPGRSLVAAHAALYPDGEKVGKRVDAPSFFLKWSSRHDWVARARAFDDYELAAKIAEREMVRERLRQRALDHSDEAIDVVIEIMRGNGPKTDGGGPAANDEFKAAKLLLDLGGASAPRQLEVTGRGGGAIETRHDDRPALRKLLANPDAVPHLRALAELQAADDDGSDS